MSDQNELAKVPESLGQLTTRPATTGIAIHRPKEVAVHEDIEAEDQAQPDKQAPLGIIRVLQAGSSQVKPRTGIGAIEGDFFNTSTGQYFSGERGLFFIPVRQYLKYPEYIKREKDGSGGGFLGIYEPENPVVKQCQDARMEQYSDLRGPLPHGQTEEGKAIELVETYYVDSICVLPDEEGFFPGEYGAMFEGSLAFSSSFIKPYNAWNDWKKGMTYPDPRTLKPIVPKLYTHVFHIRTVPRVRGGQQWMIPQISLGGKDETGKQLDYKLSKLPTDSFLYQKAAKLRADLLKGDVQLDFARDTVQSDQGGDVGNIEDTLGHQNNRRGNDEPAAWET